MKMLARALLAAILFATSALSYAENETFMGVDLSEFTPEERMEIVSVVSDKVSASKSPNQKIVIKDGAIEVTRQIVNQASKFVEFGTGLAVELVTISAAAGIEADQFVKESFWGKVALFGFMWAYVGNIIVAIIIVVLIGFLFEYGLRKLTLALFYGSTHIEEDKYEVIKVKKPWYMFLKKGQTVEKRVLSTHVYGRHGGGEAPPEAVTGFFFIAIVAFIYMCIVFNVL